MWHAGRETGADISKSPSRAQRLVPDFFWIWGLVRGELRLKGLREVPRLTGSPQNSGRDGVNKAQTSADSDDPLGLGTRASIL